MKGSRVWSIDEMRAGPKKILRRCHVHAGIFELDIILGDDKSSERVIKVKRSCLPLPLLYSYLGQCLEHNKFSIYVCSKNE